MLQCSVHIKYKTRNTKRGFIFAPSNQNNRNNKRNYSKLFTYIKSRKNKGRSIWFWSNEGGYNSIFVPLKIIVQVYNCLLYRISENFISTKFSVWKLKKRLKLYLLSYYRNHNFIPLPPMIQFKSVFSYKYVKHN